MLSFFNHFVVPGVEHVMVHHDDQDPNRFYVVPETPSILNRPNGDPAFSLIAFARDFRLLQDEAERLAGTETEGGLLGISTELAVSEDDQERIRDYIASGFSTDRRLRLVPRLTGRGIRIVPRRTAPQPTLAYPTWVDGAVDFHLFDAGETTFVKSEATSAKPSLVRTNIANYSAVLGQEGVRMIAISCEEGWQPATVNYDVSFVARIPSISVSVNGDASQAYEELKEHCTVKEVYRNGSSYRSYQYPQVSSLTEMQEIFTSLEIRVDVGDFRAADGLDSTGGDSAREEMQRIALGMIEQLVTDRFLSPGFEPGLKAEKLGTSPFAHGGDGVPKAEGNQLWLKDFEQSMSGRIELSFEASTNFTVHRYPNAQLFSLIDAERAAASIVRADLTQPIFSLLDVGVRVNADFESDPIAAIKVLMEYDEEDEKHGGRKVHTEEFIFDRADQRERFQCVKAVDADGVPKSSYRYRSQIIFKASTASVELAEERTDEQELVLSYDKLHCVNVAVFWGAIPTDTVQQIQVAFTYPGLDLPTADAQVVLRPDVPQARWFTYTEGVGTGEYEYQVTYFLADGQRIETAPQRSISDRLLINAPFTDALQATFVPQGAFPPVASIVVTARYDDGDGYDVQDVHTFSSLSESWEWSVDLRDRTKRGFTYRLDVSHVDGTTESTDWIDGQEGTVLVGPTARRMHEIEIVPDLLDMSAWKLVIVRLEYVDDEHGIDLSHTVKITGAGVDPSELTWSVPLKDPTNTTYSWTLQAFGQDNARTVVGPTETSDELLVLEV